MSNRNKSSGSLKSFIPPSFEWLTIQDVFCIEVRLDDLSIVEFISEGLIEVVFYPRAVAALTDKGTLKGKLSEALRFSKKLKPKNLSLRSGDKVLAYCHGVFLLSDERTLRVLVGSTKPLVHNTWIPDALKAEVDALWSDYLNRVEEFDKDIDRQRQKIETFYGSKNELESIGDLADGFLAISANHRRPSVNLTGSLAFIPRAVKFRIPKSDDPKKLERSAHRAMVASGLDKSRDGFYTGIIISASDLERHGLVTWPTYSAGLTAYPEIRWCLQTSVPGALLTPRAETRGNPHLDEGLQVEINPHQIQGIDADLSNLNEILQELQLDQSDLNRRVKDLSRDLHNYGFEAIAWFQPFHIWNERTWGIYFDARKLDDLALSYLADFKTHHLQGSHTNAALLAFGLTYAHELFHAQVEAALAWMEINARKPRFLRYQKNVYQKLRESPDWLEEALANWAAWNWFKRSGIGTVLGAQKSNSDGLDRVVQASLDLSPSGYREWRLGNHPSTWRTFSNQLSTGRTKFSSPGVVFPLESILTGPQPYDFRAIDVPLYFVGTGVIADRIQSHPGSLNVISRKELQQALKYYRHTVDVSGAKGSHEKWTGPNNKTFTVPRTDPVSRSVFKSFLDHIKIDKSTYIHQVRPNL